MWGRCVVCCSQKAGRAAGMVPKSAGRALSSETGSFRKGRRDSGVRSQHLADRIQGERNQGDRTQDGVVSKGLQQKQKPYQQHRTPDYLSDEFDLTASLPVAAVQTPPPLQPPLQSQAPREPYRPPSTPPKTSLQLPYDPPSQNSLHQGRPQGHFQEFAPRLTVVGVGGGGGNAVNNMISQGLEGIEFLVCNTDAQHLATTLTNNRIQLGRSLTRGLGCGANPDAGREAALESADEILDRIDGSHMVFVAAGMGGGTGTGAAPVIAQACLDAGILTVAVVTKPFRFEGRHRMCLAEEGIANLKRSVDTMIVIPNQNLIQLAKADTKLNDAFKWADNVLLAGVRSVTDLMVKPGLMNLDFADVQTVMSGMGTAMMGTGEAEGENRAEKASQDALNNPLLDLSVKTAKGMLVNVTGGSDVTLLEVDRATAMVTEAVEDPTAQIIVGTAYDAALEGRLRVSVVATGIDATNSTQAEDPFASPLRQ